MYYHEVRYPDPAEIQLIDYASRIAGIAIERDRSQSALTLAFEKIKKSEAQLRQMVDAIPQAIAVLDPEGTVLYANQWMLDYTGLSLEEAMAPNFRTKVVHPEDLAGVHDERRNALSRAMPFENEQRALGKDRKYRGFLIRYNPLRDEHGAFFAGTRPEPTLMIGSRLNRGYAMRTWRCAKRSTFLRSTKKSWDRQSRSAV